MKRYKDKMKKMHEFYLYENLELERRKTQNSAET